MTRRRPISSPPDAALLLRYVSGEATLAEADRVRRWAAADPDREASLAELKAAWEQAPSPETWDGRPLWDRIAAEMDAAPAGAAPAPELPARPRRRWRAYALAASVAAAVAGGVVVARFGGPAATVADAPIVREVATQRGQRAVFRLTDGTRIVVGPESRLHVAVGNAGRDVRLKGEAYFDVVHDSTRPFRVHTRAGIAEDIGTAFLVTAYPETEGMQVAVTHGEVALRADAAEAPLLNLVEGDLGHLDAAGTATLTRGVNLTMYRGRAEGRLVFDGMRLGDAIPMLSRWYDVEVRVSDRAVARRRLVASFQDEPVSQVMQRIALALGLEVEEFRAGQQHVFRLSAPRRHPAP